MKKKKTEKRIPYLDYLSDIGERVQWENILREKFEGVVIKMSEDFVATVRLDDGTEVEYEC